MANSALFPQDNKGVTILKTEYPVIALAMDDLNEEGLVGTASGQVYYLNLSEKVLIKLMQKASSEQEAISTVRYN